MSKLNKDILFLLFKELPDSKSLFSCLMVNRLWCEAVIPVLWRNPWNYNINYYDKSFLYYIITFYLPDDIKESLKRLGIKIPPISHQPLLFDYLSFCRSINVDVINGIIFAKSLSAFHQFLFQQEIYSLFMKKCPELKYLDMRSIQHQIFCFPEAKSRLNSICELICDKHTDPLYFYGLAYVCQNLQSLVIINTDTKTNHGIANLIEVQKNLKYFEWKDDNIWDGDFTRNPYEAIFLELAKKADTLDHFVINLQCDVISCYDYSFLHILIPKLRNLKTLKFSPSYFHEYDFENTLKLLVYNDLEVFKINDIGFNSVTCLIENSGGHLREISTNYGYGEFREDIVVLIRTIYKKCPLIECLSLVFPSTRDHFIEFENLLKNCQKLKVLLLSIGGVEDLNVKNTKSQFVDGEEISKILIRSAPNNLREIRLFDNVKFSLKSLEEFLENWRDRHALTILTCDTIYSRRDYLNLINKYKNVGVIEDFIINKDLDF